MFKELNTKIKDTLENVGSIRQIIPYPLKEGEKIKNYPCAIYFPDTAENSFETNGSNNKQYRYKLYIIVSGASQEDLWTDILPTAVDEVIAEFDKNWDMSLIGTNRVWALIDNGNWTSALTDKGVEAIAELNIRIRLSNNINN